MQQSDSWTFTTYDNAIRNVLKNEVKISPYSLHPPKSIKSNSYVAIWDTGATQTGITDRVVSECGLIESGITLLTYANGVQEKTKTFLVNVLLPNNVTVAGIEVAKMNFVGGDVLVGMDIINIGDFAISNFRGKTTFSFRTPSIETIDFLPKQDRLNPHTKVRQSPKIGRNDPCPCGSGKKYKQCCCA